MTLNALKSIEKFEADLWEAADNLRANSKLTSSDYFACGRRDLLRHAAKRFEDLVRLANSLAAEQPRATEEGLSDLDAKLPTQPEVKVLVLDTLWQSLPRPPFTDQDAEQLADRCMIMYGRGARAEHRGPRKSVPEQIRQCRR